MLPGLLVVSMLAAAPPVSTEPACSDLARNFCKELFSPQHKGHWELHSGRDPIVIRRGVTANDFSETLQRSLKLRVEHRKQFPRVLREELDRLSYFGDLDAHLASPAISDSTFSELLQRRDFASLLPQHWRAAIASAAFREVTALHPDAAHESVNRWPSQWLREQAAARERLEQGANRITWEDSPEWRKTVRAFEEVRAEMKRWLREQNALTPEQAAAVEVDLDTVQLYPPGSRSPVSDDCASVELNASYRDSDNSIEMCAGEVLTSTQEQVLAHELAHVLGPRRQMLRRERQYGVAQLFHDLRKDLCEGRPAQCSAWQKQRATLPRLLQEWTRRDPEPLHFYECLQRARVNVPPEQTLVDEARTRAFGQVRHLAARDVFLSLTRPETISSQGLRLPNPAYLNPCEAVDRFDAEPALSEEVTSVVTFVEEYACADKHMSPASRLEQSITEMRRTEELFEVSELNANVIYSSDPWTVGRGYAENLSEDSADYIAGQVFSRLVAREKDLEVRRDWFRSAIADGCEEPSWATEYPEENAVEAGQNPSEHAPDELRRVRFFNSAASLLRCRPDPGLKSCAWGKEATR